MFKSITVTVLASVLGFAPNAVAYDVDLDALGRKIDSVLGNMSATIQRAAMYKGQCKSTITINRENTIFSCDLALENSVTESPIGAASFSFGTRDMFKEEYAFGYVVNPEGIRNEETGGRTYKILSLVFNSKEDGKIHELAVKSGLCFVMPPSDRISVSCLAVIDTINPSDSYSVSSTVTKPNP
jgi:hypothetical protein